MAAVGTVAARNEFLSVLNRAAFGKERVILERRGKAIAAIVPIDDLRLLQQVEDNADIADALAARKEARKKGSKSLAQLLGEGGMGVVYKALDTRLDRHVAIKTFPSIDDPKRRRQFVWEARAAAALRHPNIVVVHDIASDRGTDFIVMEVYPRRTALGHPRNWAVWLFRRKSRPCCGSGRCW